MSTNFQVSPFTNDEIEIKSIYRSLSPFHFFITLKKGDLVSTPIMIDTLNNSFCESVCYHPTVWNPVFEAMKVLLVLGVKLKEEISEKQRKEILEKKEDSIIFGTYEFDSSEFDPISKKQVLRKKEYQFIIDNLNKGIYLKSVKKE